MASEANPPSEPSESSRAIIPFDGPATGTAEVPGSKSLTNRALVCAMLSSPKTKITLTGALRSADTTAMINAARALSKSESAVTADGTTITLRGIYTGPVEERASYAQLPVGEEPVTIFADDAGTVARFVLPVIAARKGMFVLKASVQLRTRPITELVGALEELGAYFSSGLDSDINKYPLIIFGEVLSDGPVAVSANQSSQFFSGLLLASPSFIGGLNIILSDLETAVSLPYIEMTIQVMEAFGVKVLQPLLDQPGHYVVEPGGYLPDQPDTFAYPIEPDATAAGYFWAAAAITGGEVRTEGLTFDSLQGDVRFAKVLGEMGCEVTEDKKAKAITVKGPADPSQLKGGKFDLRDISDNTQTLAAVAAFASEPVTITGVGFIRKKESDRVRLTAAVLRRRNVQVTEHVDGLRIFPNPASIIPGNVATYNDHRMAMSMSLLGLKVDGIKIEDPECVNKTFPNFFQALEKLRP